MIVQGYIQASFDWKSIVENPLNLKDKIVKVYLLAKEGVSNPKFLGSNSKPLIWTREAIYSLASKVKVGIQAFIGHGKTNEDKNRPEIGSLVGHSVKEVSGNLHHYVAIASDKDHNYNVISMEAEIYYDDDTNQNKGSAIVKFVENLTGLALGVKGKDIPGVEGAEMVAQMQFFNNEEIENKTQTRKEMTKEEIKAAMREHGGYVTDYVSIGDVLGKAEIVNGKLTYDGNGDPKITKAIEKHILGPVNSLLEQQAVKINEYEPMINDYKTLKVNQERLTAKDKVSEIVKSRSLTEQHQKFLETELSEFDPSSQKVDEFVDSKLTKFKSMVDAGLIVLKTPDGNLPDPKGESGGSSSYEKEYEEAKEIN